MSIMYIVSVESVTLHEKEEWESMDNTDLCMKSVTLSMEFLSLHDK